MTLAVRGIAGMLALAISLAWVARSQKTVGERSQISLSLWGAESGPHSPLEGASSRMASSGETAARASPATV